MGDTQPRPRSSTSMPDLLDFTLTAPTTSILWIMSRLEEENIAIVSRAKISLRCKALLLEETMNIQPKSISVPSSSKKTSLLQINIEKTKEKLNPTVDYTKNYNHFSGSRFIIECGIKLKANVLTIATACHYYHKFFTVATLEEYDPYLIGSTCIYLATKVEDDDIRIRDIINVGINCVRRNEPPLSLDPYFSLRDSLIQAELLLMRILGFFMKVDLPHKYLLHYMQSLREWVGEEVFTTLPIVHQAWTIIQDIYHSPIVIHHSPQILAVATLNIVLQVYGVVVPGDDEVNDRSWFTVLNSDCTTKAVWDLSVKILDIYRQEGDIFLVS